ncbi:MAG: transcriptional regulator [Bacteroidetes bacterium]|jgi:DNA-binding HxlR family transcriptional regulator|nr:transcriptional regulator [Bacteroidota bacterium]
MKTRKTTSTNYENEVKNLYCPVTLTLQKIGGRWKPLVLYQLIEDKKRYSELKKGIPNITEKMLIETLKELEQDKIITRKAFPVVPPRVEYSLSAFGKTLCPVLDAMAKWGASNQRRFK